jgi:hypothetical protein
VSRGENKNRTLKHSNVVRRWDTKELLENDELTVAMPSGLDPANSAVVLYIQHRKNLKILGAAKINLK